MTEVRDAEQSDAAAIAAVQVASWQKAYRGLLPDDVLDALSVEEWAERRAALLRRPPPHTAHLVATVDDAVVGFTALGRNRSDAVDGELYALYVHPELWRAGVGSRLHGAAMRRLAALGFAESTLWVLEGNERALAFYHRVGWVDDGLSTVDTGPGGVALPERRLRYARTLAS